MPHSKISVQNKGTVNRNKNPKHMNDICHMIPVKIRAQSKATMNSSVSREVRDPSNAPIVFLSKKPFPHCLVLVGSRFHFECDLHKQYNACFTIELN